MLRPLRCVRFGEVLLDENLRTFLLCTSCQAEFANLQQFGAHFKSSACGSAFFPDSASRVKWPIDNVTNYKRHCKGQQQYLVYNVKELTIKTTPNTKLISASAAAAAPTTTTQTPTAPQIFKTEKDDDYLDLLKIEEELLDPRWYTDLEPVVDAASSASAAPNSNQILAYNELVEAVTPYVQFKENMHKYPGKSTKVKKVQVPATKTIVVKEKVGHNQAPIESNRDGQAAAVNRKNVVGTRVLHPTAKRCLAIEMQELDSLTSSTPAVIKQQKRELAAAPTNKYIVQVIDDNSQQSTPTTSPAIKRRKTTIIPLEQFQNQLADKKETNIPKTLPQSKKIQPIAQVAKAKEEQQTRPPPQKQPMLLGSKTAAPPAAPVKPSIQQTKANGDSARTETATGSSRAPPSVKQTEQILTKLQTLGLQVKRTQPASGSSAAPPTTKIDETLELVKKLQSKGMKVKVVNKEMAAGASTPKKKLPKPTAVADSQVAMTVKTKTAGLSRSLIIKKVK